MAFAFASTSVNAQHTVKNTKKFEAMSMAAYRMKCKPKGKLTFTRFYIKGSHAIVAYFNRRGRAVYVGDLSKANPTKFTVRCERKKKK